MATTTGEKEKQLLAATVRERLIGNKNYVVYRELLEEKIPTFLNNYLQNTVRKLVHTEEPIQIKNSKRFNFESDKIKQLKTELIKAFEEATIFPRQELIEIINKTVSLQFDLLIRPNTTLLKIFYQNRSDRIQGEILQILQGLEDDRIFVKTLIQKIKEFDQYHIVEEDFKRILFQTEKEVYDDDFITAFKSDVKFLMDFLSMIRGNNHEKIHIDLIRLLLSERNLEQFKAAFEFYNEEMIHVNEVFSILQDFIKAKKYEEEKLEEEIDNFIMYSVAKGENGEDEEMKKTDMMKDQPETVDATLKTETKAPHRRITKITNIDKDPMDMVIKRSKIEEQPEGPLYSLRVLIDDKSEKFITKRIFDNNKEEYDEFIEQLDLIDSWKKAKEIIDKELYIRSVKPFSKEALRLGDLVFNRYFPKKKV